MELEQLRDIWKHEQLPNENRQELSSFLGKRSNNPISKMRRNLNLELVAVLVLYGASVIYYFQAFRGKMQEASWFMIAIAVLFFLYYFRKKKLLKQMECVTCQVKSNLQTQIRILEKYVRFYLIAGTLLVPFTIIFFSWLVYIKFPQKPIPLFFPGGTYPFWQSALAWIGFIGLTTLLVYLLNKWYVRKLYGEHIQKLRILVDELNEG